MENPSFLFLSNYYLPQLEYFEKKYSFDDLDYQAHKQKLEESVFDISYLYAEQLRKKGYRAGSIIVNAERLQKKWGREEHITFSSFSLHPARRSYLLRSLISKFPQIYYGLKSRVERKEWNYKILMAQIAKFRPDILHIVDLHYFSPAFLKEVRTYAKIIVGQTSSPLFLSKNHLRLYDLLLSSYPHYVAEFRRLGMRAEYFRHAFEPTIFQKFAHSERIYPCVFVGGLSHLQEGFSLLEQLAQTSDIRFWGYSNPPLPSSSPVLKKYHGQAWGEDMYQILAQSKIVLNRHISAVAKNYANNLRLFEATGMGAMLITDMKDNLGEIFEIGKEVETYTNPEELTQKIQFYLTHDTERERIAKAGQDRIIRDHTYEKRVEELTTSISKYF